MKSEVTMIDKSGRDLVSGTVKSDKVQESSAIGFRDSELSGASSEIQTNTTEADQLYPKLLASFLDQLGKEPGK